MVAVRGMRSGTYTTDSGVPYQTNVDDDYYQNAHFGWTAYTTIPRQKLPRGFKPRHVTGLSPTTGRRAVARVPDVTADVWTGVTSTFTGQTNIGGTDTYNIVDRIPERPSL